MGTRNLTVVIHNDEIKMAQYGQWDGYPSGVGKDIAKVMPQASVKKWRKVISNCKFLTAAEVKAHWKAAGDNSDLATEILSRDNSGGKALELILVNNGAELFNQIKFAADSLFCEWAYVIDFDKQNVEVYKGFNQIPLTKADRFFFLQQSIKPAENVYFPVKLYKTYKIKSFTTRAMTALEKRANKEAEEIATK
jgi:hypothetical protein